MFRLRLALAALFLFLLAFPGFAAQNAKSTQSTTSAQATKAPENPITETQIREFYDVCHIPIVSRKLTHEKLEIQRKQLPPWYPQPVWDEIEAAIDGIDLPATTLPVYQKYVSEDLAGRLIKFLATHPGQEAVQIVLEKMIQAQHAGASVLESHQQAVNYLIEDKNGVANKIVSEMTPEQRRNAESLGSEYVRMQPVFAKINQECSRAIIDKQTELVKTIVLKHQEEMVAAKENYEQGHPETGSAEGAGQTK